MTLAVHPSVPVTLAQRVCTGERSAVARALNLLDDRRDAAQTVRHTLLATLPPPEAHLDAQLLGLTGPPGAGKSSLISALIGAWRRAGLTVGVLAADPTSPLSGGALLGDRVRMDVAPGDDGVFIRSLASRGSYGGLSPEVLPMAAVMLAAFDRVIIETVGVGQREVDVAFAADTTCLAVQPGAGDGVQYLKAGVMEIPEILVVTKSDLGPIAERTRNDLAACVESRHIPVIGTSAVASEGIDELVGAFDYQHARLRAGGLLVRARRAAQAAWLIDRLVEEFGRHGMSRLGGRTQLKSTLTCGAAPILPRLDEHRNRTLRLLGGGPGEVFKPVSQTNDNLTGA